MNRHRFFFVVLIFLLFGGAVVARLFFVQVINKFVSGEIRNSHVNSTGDNTVTEGISGVSVKRGNIFIQDKSGDLYAAATSRLFLRVSVNPSKIFSQYEDSLSDKLSNVLAISQNNIKERLAKKSDSYQMIAERVDMAKKPQLQEILKSFPAGSIGLEEYSDRFYPYGKLASHVLGFVGFSENIKEGLYGLEKYYQKILSQGNDPSLQVRQGVQKVFAAIASSPADENGASLVLTIDFTIQSQAEKILDDLIKKWSAPSGSIVVMRPQDGAILAMASSPTFDPNEYSKVNNLSTLINPAVQNVFEPGSIVKPFTLASGIDTGVVTPQTMFDDKGPLQRSGYTINNAGHRIFGKRSMMEVLQFSINTGAVFVVEKVGAQNFLHYLESFGFGMKTNIDLPGEVQGDITNLDSGRAINLATAAFGQGISVTPIQIITALNTIANGGKLVKPFLVQKILYPDGREEATQPEVVRQPISSQTAAKLTAMMVEVVEKGYSKKARVQGYSIAGKSGTAQIPNPNGGYSEQTIHSFMGFAPAFNPVFIILIKLDEPVGIRFSSDSLTPDFSRLSKFILDYYNIPPDKNTSPSAKP